MKALDKPDYWRVLIDHGSFTGRGREAPSRPGSTFLEQVFNVSKVDKGSRMPIEATAGGYQQPCFYWPDAITAPGKPPSGKRHAPRPPETSIGIFEYVSAAATRTFLGVDPDSGAVFARGIAQRVLDLSLSASREHVPMRLVGFDDAPNKPVIAAPVGGGGTIAGQSGGIGSGAQVGPGGEYYPGVHDDGVEELVGRVAGPPMPSFHPTLFVAGCDNGQSAPVGYPAFTNTLFCDYQSLGAEQALLSTRVADINPNDFGPDPQAIGSAASAWRVVSALGDTGNKFALAPRSVAINGGLAPDNILAGRGQFTQQGFLPNFAGAARPHLIDYITGYASITGGGPLSAGGGLQDKHLAGVDAAGGVHVGGHLDCRSPWYFTNIYDAPPLHGGDWVETGGGSGVWVPVHLKYDKDLGHLGCGENFLKSPKAGIHRWQVQIPIYIPEPPDPPPFPPPPPPFFPIPGQPVPIPIPSGGFIDPFGPGGRLFTPPPSGELPEEEKLRLRAALLLGQKLEVIYPTTIFNLSTYLRTWNWLGTPGMVFTPMPLGVDDDYTFTRSPDAIQRRDINNLKPSALLLPFGSQAGGVMTDATVDCVPCLFANGATAGGLCLYPPTRGLDQRIRECDCVPETHFTLWNDGTTATTFLSFGDVSQIGGAKVKSGWAVGLESAQLKFLRHNSSGVRQTQTFAIGDSFTEVRGTNSSDVSHDLRAANGLAHLRVRSSTGTHASPAASTATSWFDIQVYGRDSGVTERLAGAIRNRFTAIGASSISSQWEIDSCDAGTYNRFILRPDGKIRFGDQTNYRELVPNTTAVRVATFQDRDYIIASQNTNNGFTSAQTFTKPITAEDEFEHTGATFGIFGVTPVAQPATIADPSGGATQDAESRTAIIAILDALKDLGIIALA